MRRSKSPSSRSMCGNAARCASHVLTVAWSSTETARWPTHRASRRRYDDDDGERARKRTRASERNRTSETRTSRGMYATMRKRWRGFHGCCIIQLVFDAGSDIICCRRVLLLCRAYTGEVRVARDKAECCRRGASSANETCSGGSRRRSVLSSCRSFRR